MSGLSPTRNPYPFFSIPVVKIFTHVSSHPEPAKLIPVHYYSQPNSHVPAPLPINVPISQPQTAQSKFAQIAEAYEILSDDSTRELYDHARRVRAAAGRYHQQQHNHGDGGADFAGGVFDDGDWRQDEWASAQWYQDYVDAMGMGDGLFFGSSFGTGGGGGGFDAGFEQGPFGVGGEGAWGGGHGVRFEFRPRDPMELFDVSYLMCMCVWRRGCLMEGAGRGVCGESGCVGAVQTSQSGHWCHVAPLFFFSYFALVPPSPPFLLDFFSR